MTKIRKAILALYTLERIGDKEGSVALLDYLTDDAKIAMRDVLHKLCVRCKHDMGDHYIFDQDNCHGLEPSCRKRRCKCKEFAEDNLEYMDQEAVDRGII